MSLSEGTQISGEEGEEVVQLIESADFSETEKTSYFDRLRNGLEAPGVIAKEITGRLQLLITGQRKAHSTNEVTTMVHDTGSQPRHITAPASAYSR